jgi:hypothetical protein
MASSRVCRQSRGQGGARRGVRHIAGVLRLRRPLLPFPALAARVVGHLSPGACREECCSGIVPFHIAETLSFLVLLMLAVPLLDLRFGVLSFPCEATGRFIVRGHPPALASHEVFADLDEDVFDHGPVAVLEIFPRAFHDHVVREVSPWALVFALAQIVVEPLQPRNVIGDLLRKFQVLQ